MNEELKAVEEAAKVSPFGIDYLTYLWVCVVAGWGGLVRFLNSMRQRKETIREAVITLIVGIVTSTFVGVITFWMCRLANFEDLSTAICVAVTGHMGAECLRFFQSAIMSRLRSAWLAMLNVEKVNE